MSNFYKKLFFLVVKKLFFVKISWTNTLLTRLNWFDFENSFSKSEPNHFDQNGLAWFGHHIKVKKKNLYFSLSFYSHGNW